MQPSAVSASGECHRAAAIALLPVLAVLKYARSPAPVVLKPALRSQSLVNSYSSRISAELQMNTSGIAMERASTRLADSIR